MKPKNVPILISGYAGSGKNLFCSVLSEKLHKLNLLNTTLAFANTLKKDCQKEILEKYNIDILNCSRAEKDRVRHILVERATENRATDPDYYVKLLDRETYNWDVNYILISDCRNENEAEWGQENKGIVVYLSLYEFDYSENKMRGAVDIKVLEPANETEAATCKEVEKICDYYLQWRKKPKNCNLTNEKWVEFWVDNFIAFYQRRGFIPYPESPNG